MFIAYNLDFKFIDVKIENVIFFTIVSSQNNTHVQNLKTNNLL